jgi:hypothetical protein
LFQASFPAICSGNVHFFNHLQPPHTFVTKNYLSQLMFEFNISLD